MSRIRNNFKQWARATKALTLRQRHRSGTGTTYARGNHVHPHDTSKQDKLTAGYGITITDNTIAVSIPNANGVSF